MQTDKYFYYVIETVKRIDQSAIDQAKEALIKARQDSKRVFIIGNGGSNTTADHIVCDLFKNVNPPLNAMSLSNLPTITAYANDHGYQYIYSAQLAKLADIGDVLIAISTSGDSQNVINAIDIARMRNMVIIGLTAFDGGMMKGRCDIELFADTVIIEVAEDVHLSMLHCIVKGLKDG